MTSAGCSRPLKSTVSSRRTRQRTTRCAESSLKSKLSPQNPISPEILRAVAQRVQADSSKDSHLLLPPDAIDEAGPFDVALPRPIAGLDVYAPAYLHLPYLRRLATVVSS